MANRLLLHTNDAGEVFVNDHRVQWLRYVDSKLYVRPHPRAVFVRDSGAEADGAVFFSRYLSYEVWDFVELIAEVEALLRLASSPGEAVLMGLMEIEADVVRYLGVELATASELGLDLGVHAEMEMEMEIVVAGGA